LHGCIIINYKDANIAFYIFKKKIRIEEEEVKKRIKYYTVPFKFNILENIMGMSARGS
jgi:hypothetical protein